MKDQAPKAVARVALGLWLLLTTAIILVLGFQFVTANAAVSDASGDATRSVSWIGIPVFEVFNRDGKQGANIFWGLPTVVFGVPIVVATVVGYVARRRITTATRREA